MSGHTPGPTPGPWHWGHLYDDGSGPDALLGPSGEKVLAPFLDVSLEPGEGIDDWGLEANIHDLPMIAAAPETAAELERVREALTLAMEAACPSCAKGYPMSTDDAGVDRKGLYHIDKHHSGTGFGGGHHKCRAWKARAALAKHARAETSR